MTLRPRRALFGALGLALVVLIVIVVVRFAWPSAQARAPRVDVGALDAFAPGTVTFVRPTDNRGRPYMVFTPTLIEPGDNPARLDVVRYADGSMQVFSAVDPHSGCTLPWRANFTYDGRRGWFRDPCHGSTYDLSGRRVFGPSPRNMDRYRFEVTRSGRVIVDLGALETGGTNLDVPGRTTPTPVAPPGAGG